MCIAFDDVAVCCLLDCDDHFLSTEATMPERKTIERAKRQAEGKAPSTQAGEFVREEMDHIREASTAPGRPSRR
jgi:hypothetical protein